MQRQYLAREAWRSYAEAISRDGGMEVRPAADIMAYIDADAAIMYIIVSWPTMSLFYGHPKALILAPIGTRDGHLGHEPWQAARGCHHEP